MNSDFFNFYNVFARTAFDAARQLADINARAYERLVKRQIELSSNMVESSLKQFVSHTVAAQKEIAEEYADKAQQANKDTVQIINQAQDELAGYLQNELPAAMEQVRSAVKDVTQEAAQTARSGASRKAA
jgi:hypothetical protein